MDLSEIGENSNRHPWELSRKDNMIKLVKKYIHENATILDIGCGDSYFDQSLLEALPKVKEIWGVDIFLPQNELRSRYSKVNHINEVPINSFDLVLLMDVLEHNEDETEVLTQVKHKMHKNGRMIVTVPAFQWLYSAHDKNLNHYRRYNYRQLKEVIEKNDFEIEDWFYFYASLVPMRFLSKNAVGKTSQWKRDERNFFTKFVRLCLNIDFNVCKYLSKVNIHLGGLSLLMVVKKKSNKNDIG